MKKPKQKKIHDDFELEKNYDFSCGIKGKFYKNSKINGVSLFANVGIAETFVKKHGIKIKVANELLQNRANFYNLDSHHKCNT
ncbi:MAG: hypothetical protein DRQ51_08380 [Gammaproteobacteria bacterium]|nr:MAG: hypothetical protein DRQ51_08380 [Gammaproteobacteria bacterium]